MSFYLKNSTVGAIVAVAALYLFFLGCGKNPQNENSNAASTSTSTETSAKEESSRNVENPSIVPGKLPQEVQKTVASQGETSVSDWASAFNKGKALVKAGETKKASYYFANALGKVPGNMDVIETYKIALQKVIDNSDDDAKFGYLDALKTFLQNQIMTVPENQLEKLLAWIDEIDKQQSALDAKQTAGEEEIAQDNPIDEIEDSFKQMKKSMQEQQDYVKKSRDNGYLDIASYQLQECEQIMRGIIILQPKLSTDQQKEVSNIYSNLKKLADSVVDKKSEILWNEYLVSYDKYVTKMNQIGIEQSTPVSTLAKGCCQQKIELLQMQMAELQKIMPQLSEKYLGNVVSKDNPENTAVNRLQKIQKELEESIQRQQKQYNTWAMSKIRTCLEDAQDGVGYFANGDTGRRKIDEALVKHMGPIDQRYLTSEVARCYQEVQGKYLADNQLNPPKNDSSFDQPGNKMHALKEMYEYTKIKLSQF